MKRLVKAFLRIYQAAISPFLGRNCRFHPTCSAYALEAVDRYGPCKGLWMGMCRVARCHPWQPGGYDPVPDKDKS